MQPPFMPRMLYKAVKLENGRVRVIDYENAAMFPGTTTIVRSEEELRLAESLGWCRTPAQALEMFEHEEQEIANAAAERAYDDRNMSEQAKAEADAVESGPGVKHVVEIPEGPKRGRPKKHH